MCKTEAASLQVDPTLTRADRLVGQVLGEVGALPDVFTEVEINFFLLRRLLGVRTQVCLTCGAHSWHRAYGSSVAALIAESVMRRFCKRNWGQVLVRECQAPRSFIAGVNVPRKAQSTMLGDNFLLTSYNQVPLFSDREAKSKGR